MLNRRQRLRDWWRDDVKHYIKYKLTGHLFRIYTICLTFIAIYMAYYIVERDTSLEDFMIVRTACPSQAPIESRAESVFYGKVTRLVFYCK